MQFALDIIGILLILLRTSTATQIEDHVSICGNLKSNKVAGTGILYSDEAKTLSSVGEHAQLWILSNHSLPVSPVECSLVLTACAICQIQISWDLSNLGTFIYSGKDEVLQSSLRDPGMERCSDISFVQDPCLEIVFQEDQAGALRNGPYRHFGLLEGLGSRNFTSTASKMIIKIKMNSLQSVQQERFLKRLFPLKIDVIDNTIVRTGRPSKSSIGSGTKNSYGFIQSPRFPAAYPESVTINYTLINEDGGPVRLTFEDFQLHYMSKLKILDSDNEEILNTQGQFGSAEGRPSAVQSKGDRLEIIFTGNHYTQKIGFRAKYEFVHDDHWPERPESNSRGTCDSLYEKSGGSISIPANSIGINTYVDCLWIIGKSRYGSMLNDMLYVKVEDFSVTSNSKGIRLEIRNEKTSTSKLLMDAWGPKSPEELAGMQPQDGFVVDLRRVHQLTAISH